MPAAPEIAVEVRITGRVQGVGYRAWARAEAEGLGLAGWVRNEPDGSVRALFAGREAAVAATLERCRKGPIFARVDAVATRPAVPVPGAEGFRLSR